MLQLRHFAIPSLMFIREQIYRPEFLNTMQTNAEHKPADIHVEFYSPTAREKNIVHKYSRCNFFRILRKASFLPISPCRMKLHT